MNRLLTTAILLCLSMSSVADASLWLYSTSKSIWSATGSYSVGTIVTLEWTMEQPPASAFIGQGGFIQVKIPNATIYDGSKTMPVAFWLGVLPPGPSGVSSWFEYGGGGPIGPPGYTDPRLSITESEWIFNDPATGDSWKTGLTSPIQFGSIQPIPEASSFTAWFGLLSMAGVYFLRFRGRG